MPSAILTPEQVASARALRAEGLTYRIIAKRIGAKTQVESVRYHCSDLPAERTRTVGDKTITAKDGRVIRPFSEHDDARIIAWINRGQPEGGDGDTLAALSKRIDRKRHSVAARIRSLRRAGKLPPA